MTESRFDASRGDSALTPLVGREEELDLLLRRWSQAKDGEGQVVLLSGEPGIGKSRILSTLRERLDAEGVQALRFQCSPYYVNSAFWPIIDNFERTLKFTRDETGGRETRQAGSAGRHALRPAAGRRPVRRCDPVDPLRARYGALPMTPQKHKDETLRTLVDLVEAAARKQPSVMLFEDAHWADPTTLEVLDLLIDRVRTVPLLVVLTHRPEFQSRWSGQGHVGALNLSKLTRAQSAAMVSALAGGKALPAALLEQILTRTDGVPLFVEELTKSILESGELKEAGDHYEYAGSARAVTIPATLRDSLMARLDRFMPVKEIAQIGAAIGREFSYELIAAVAPMPQAQLDDALVRLSESGLAFRRGTPPDADLHLQARAGAGCGLRLVAQEPQTGVARQDRPRDRGAVPEHQDHRTRGAGASPHRRGPCRSRHSALAGRWRAGAEAHGPDRGHLPSQPGARTGLHPASVIATRRQRTGAAHPPWHSMGGAQRLGRPGSLDQPASGPCLGEVARAPRRAGAHLLGTDENVLAQGRVAEALPWAEEMLDIAEATGDADLLITGHAHACVCYCWAGEFTKAVEHADKVLDLYDAEKHRHLADILNHDPKTRAGIFGSMCTWILGYPDRALRLSDEKDAHARRRGHPFDLGFALTIGAHEFDHRCELEDLRKRAEECERLGRENSLPVLWAIMAPVSYGQALIQEGKPPKE